MTHFPHRQQGYSLLAGRGLEIGALHEPAALPPGCSVTYFDAITRQEASTLFPEVDPAKFVNVDVIGDLDEAGLNAFDSGSFDFLIISHVLEHLANPVKTLREVFRVVKPHGQAVIAIPDKRFTFDRGREPTPFEHLWSDYERGVVESSDEHYLDFLRSAAPHVFTEAPEQLPHHVQRCRRRREHAHVWTSAGFAEFLKESFTRLGIRAEARFRSTGDENHLEYFAVWRKLPPNE